MKSRWLGLVIVLAFGTLTLTRADDSVSLPLARSGDIDAKLRSIVVSIDFDHATIDQATAALSSMSHQLDPDHKGVQFVVEPEASASAKSITLKLNDVPLREALRYACLLANVQYKVGNSAVSIRRMGWVGNEMVMRTFHVDPNFVEAATKAGILMAAPVQ